MSTIQNFHFYLLKQYFITNLSKQEFLKQKFCFLLPFFYLDTFFITLVLQFSNLAILEILFKSITKVF